MGLPSRYKRLSRGLLAGGFGDIVPLEDTYLRRIVLLKTMQDPANNGQLQNEIRGLCAARSRHVVDVYDVVKNERGDIEGIIIERLRGRDYVNFYTEAPTNPDSYLRVLYQIAVALNDLHAVGIIHRDLKLDNFKASASGVVKLFDFGISSPDGGYKTIQNKGTLTYAAPELYVAGATITREMDIYAFGICAWALAHNVFPAELLERPPQSSKRVASIATLMPTDKQHASGLHPEVVTLIDSTLHPDATQRPSAAALVSTLGRHLIRSRHRGIFIQNGSKVVELSQSQPQASLKVGTLGEISIAYNGLDFIVVSTSGAVRINNTSIAQGDILQGTCVIAFGDLSLGPQQQWVSFISSHPEVVL